MRFLIASSIGTSKVGETLHIPLRHCHQSVECDRAQRQRNKRRLSPPSAPQATRRPIADRITTPANSLSVIKPNMPQVRNQRADTPFGADHLGRHHQDEARIEVAMRAPEII